MQTNLTSIICITTLFALGTIVSSTKDSSTPSVCDPGILEEMPQHIKKVCIALENSNQLSNALNMYLRKEAPAVFLRDEDLGIQGTGKRTDVDHVFLRFGRR